MKTTAAETFQLGLKEVLHLSAASALAVAMAQPALAGANSKRKASDAMSAYGLAEPVARQPLEQPYRMRGSFVTDPDENIRASLRREEWWRKG